MEFDRSQRHWSPDGLVRIVPDLVPPLAAMLQRAVEEYGPDEWGEWKPGGVALFGPDASVRRSVEHKAFFVYLPEDAEDDMDLALFFLAHEAVHCLHFDREGGAPMIEEGAAVRLSLIGPRYSEPEYAERGREWQMSLPGGEHYAVALGAVEALLAINPEAIRTRTRWWPRSPAVHPAPGRA